MRRFIGIFLCSFSALAFEVTLTRVFSISLWYHFAFMVISIGMLGIGLSGTVQSLFPGIKRYTRLNLYSLLLGTSIPLSYIITNLIPFDPVRLTWDRVQLLYVSLYYLVLSVPFFFFGLVISTAFSTASEASGIIYGADLLGAGTGSVVSIFLIGTAGPEKAVFLVSFAALLGAFIMGNRLSSLVAIAFVLLALLAGHGITGLRMSPYKGLEQAMRYPGAAHVNTYQGWFSRVDVFKSPMVRFAPGLSLEYLEELPAQEGLSIDGSHITAITQPSEGKMEFLRFLPSALPYEMRKRTSALVIDPKGGLQVLLARYYEVERIRAVESDPLVADVIRKDFGEFSGDLYAENTETGLARSRLMRMGETFDILDLSMTGTVPRGVFGISEDYRFTVEAFREYISHLKPDGLLSISLFILPPPRTELRLLSTAVRALEEMGIDGVKDNIVAIRSWGSICMLVKPTPFTPGEITRLKSFSWSRRFDLVYYPGIKKKETNIFVKTATAGYHDAFVDIITPETRSGYMKDYVFDVTPVVDDRPFFYYFLKLKNVRETYNLMGRKWQYFIEEGFLLPAVLVQVCVLSLILLLLPAFFRGKGRPGFDFMLLYFAFLGIGFMFVEVPLIQKMILPLENAPYAVAGVLFSILVSSGTGSLLSNRYAFLRSPLTVLALAAIVVPYGLLINVFAESLLGFPLLTRFALAFALIFPAGFSMGIPFPLGIRKLGERNQLLIPWAWAINGCLSVLSPVLATMLAMTIGFRGVLLLGGGMYVLAFAVLKRTT